jgi:hypothetical protein
MVSGLTTMVSQCHKSRAMLQNTVSPGQRDVAFHFLRVKTPSRLGTGQAVSSAERHRAEESHFDPVILI